MPEDAVRHATGRAAPTNPAAGTVAISMATVRHVIEVPALNGGMDGGREGHEEDGHDESDVSDG